MSTPLRVADLFRESVRGHNSDNYSHGDPYEMNRLIRYENDNGYKVAVFNITHNLFQGDSEYCENILDFLTGWCEGCNPNKLRCDNDKYYYYVNNIGIVDKIQIDKYEKIPKRFKCFELCRSFEVIEYSYAYTDGLEVLVREKVDGWDKWKSISDSHDEWVKRKLCSCDNGLHCFFMTKLGPVFCTYDKKYEYWKDLTFTTHYRQCIPYNDETKHLEGTNTDYKYSMFH